MPDDDWPDTIPITPEVAGEVVHEVNRHLPDGWRLMPIGGTYLGLGGFSDVASTTKDVDLVATITTDGNAAIPEYEDVFAFANEHSDHVRGRRDHTSVAFVFEAEAEAGPADVEFVRGRATRQAGTSSPEQSSRRPLNSPSRGTGYCGRRSRRWRCLKRGPPTTSKSWSTRAGTPKDTTPTAVSSSKTT